MVGILQSIGFAPIMVYDKTCTYEQAMRVALQYNHTFAGMKWTMKDGQLTYTKKNR